MTDILIDSKPISEIGFEVDMPLHVTFKEFPNSADESIAYQGVGAKLRVGFLDLQTKALLFRPFFLLQAGQYVPSLLNEETKKYDAQKELALRHLDVGGGVFIGVRVGDKGSCIGLTAALMGSSYYDAPENLNADVDRYGNYENPLDQGGFTIPLQLEHAQMSDGSKNANLTASFGALVQIAVLKQLGINIGANLDLREMKTTTHDTLSARSFNLSLGASYLF
ncbi:MAG: hypothetical protein ABII18_01245 [bacterium]|nr:hypothetical protein [bacterium]MBU1917128.1 hypothetical protein [bacterium]